MTQFTSISILFLFLFSEACSISGILLLEPKANYGVATHESLVFLAGGYDNYGVTDSVAYIDMKNERSGNTNDLSVARAFIVGTTVQNLAIFAGGILDNGKTSNAIDIFNFTSVVSLRTTQTLSVSRTDIAATSIGNLAFFAGGSSDDVFYDTIDIFDYTSFAWTTWRLSVPRSKIAATTAGHLAFFAGGLSSTGDSSAIDIYDSNTLTWSTASLSAPRRSIAPVSFDQTAYFFGGSNSSNVDVFNVESNVNTTFYMPGNGSFSATAVGTAIFLVNQLAPTGSVAVYGYITKSWSVLIGDLFRYRLTPVTVSIPWGQAALFAGGAGPNDTLSSLVSYTSYCNFSSGYPYGSNATSCPSPYPSPSSSHYVSGLGRTELIVIVSLGVGGTAVISVITIIVVMKILRKRREYSKLLSEIPITKIKDVELLHLLGSGQFGEVYKGTWMKTTTVAVKKLKNKDFLHEFEHEVAILCNLNHPHCVRLYGIYEQKGQQMMVFEYLADGNLSTLLQTSTITSTIDLIKMAQHIVNGMLYLEENHIIHRDLALRNVLVTSTNGKYVAKVSDFGMSRAVDSDYYKTEDRTIAVKWAAIESIAYGKFSSKSDVWSFGICLWELFSMGKLPYPGMSNAVVIKQVESGYRLPPPDNCPEEMYKLMHDCWEEEPASRPTFSQIALRLDEIESKYNDKPTIMAECAHVMDVEHDGANIYN